MPYTKEQRELLDELAMRAYYALSNALMYQVKGMDSSSQMEYDKLISIQERIKRIEPDYFK